MVGLAVVFGVGLALQVRVWPLRIWVSNALISVAHGLNLVVAALCAHVSYNPEAVDDVAPWIRTLAMMQSVLAVVRALHQCFVAVVESYFLKHRAAVANTDVLPANWLLFLLPTPVPTKPSVVESQPLSLTGETQAVLEWSSLSGPLTGSMRGKTLDVTSRGITRDEFVSNVNEELASLVKLICSTRVEI